LDLAILRSSWLNLERQKIEYERAKERAQEIIGQDAGIKHEQIGFVTWKKGKKGRIFRVPGEWKKQVRNDD